MTAISIFRQFGSHGDTVAQLLCDRSGYRYFDKNLMGMYAGKASIKAQGVKAFKGGSPVDAFCGSVDIRIEEGGSDASNCEGGIFHQRVSSIRVWRGRGRR